MLIKNNKRTYYYNKEKCLFTHAETGEYLIDYCGGGFFARQLEECINRTVGTDVDRIKCDSRIECGNRLVNVSHRIHAALTLSLACEAGGVGVKLVGGENFSDRLFKLISALAC